MSADGVRPDLAAVRAAHDRIRPFVHRTPVLTCQSLDKLAGCRVFFKCENLQKVGAFKARGAVNAVMSLPDADAARGVVTHSSGNHAAALAYAGRLRGIRVDVVMPTNAPPVKRAAVEGYGGIVTPCEPTLESRESTAAKIIAELGSTMIHPFNDHRVIAGQATAVVELLEDHPDLDVVLSPVGGGGLLSGTAIAAKAIRPDVRVIGCEPELADDAFRSLAAGNIQPVLRTDTIGDGLRTSLGDKTFPIIRDLVDGIALADEATMVRATMLFIERAKFVVEPSGAVGFAALLQGSVAAIVADWHADMRVGIILSGGNLDLRAFATAIGERGQ